MHVLLQPTEELSRQSWLSRLHQCRSFRYSRLASSQSKISDIYLQLNKRRCERVCGRVHRPTEGPAQCDGHLRGTLLGSCHVHKVYPSKEAILGFSSMPDQGERYLIQNTVCLVENAVGWKDNAIRRWVRCRLLQHLMLVPGGVVILSNNEMFLYKLGMG